MPPAPLPVAVDFAWAALPLSGVEQEQRPLLPPIAVPDTVTVPPFAELPKTAGPSPPLDRVAIPPSTPFPPIEVNRDLVASDTGCLGVCAASLARAAGAATASIGRGGDKRVG